MRWLIFTHLILCTPVLAMSDQEFQATRNRLQESQKKTERLLQQIGIRSAFEEPRGQASEEDRPVSPLFRIHGNISSARLVPGKLLFGKVLNRLVVGGDGSPVLLTLDDSQGSFSFLRIMGTARQSGTSGRLAIEAQRIVLRDGRAVPIQATVLDDRGSFGLEAQVFSQKAWSVAGAMTSSFVAGLAASQQTQNVTAFGFSQAQPTGRNALLQGVAQTAADQSKRLIEEATAEKPILIVEPDTPVSVLIQEEVRF